MPINIGEKEMSPIINFNIDGDLLYYETEKYLINEIKDNIIYTELPLLNRNNYIPVICFICLTPSTASSAKSSAPNFLASSMFNGAPPTINLTLSRNPASLRAS